MNKIKIPEGYVPALKGFDLQCAIASIRKCFQAQIEEHLNLRRVSAPLFVLADSGLNDNLSGWERPVGFDVPAIGKDAQVVHSLAKWKRLALKTYGFSMHEGLYTDMNAIRRDEELDNLHSIYVDQWDWEKIISVSDRNFDYLKETVRNIVTSVCNTLDELKKEYPSVKTDLSRDVTFITSQELEDMFPDLTPEEREQAFLKDHKTTFIMQIGGALASGKPHGNRAPDYDDWELNGDLLFWDDTLDCAFELSSMGIRVSPESLDRQLTIAKCDDRRTSYFHSLLLNGELPYTIGGGIGQSRLCMLLLGCAHIGEVQSSLWDDATKTACAANGIHLL